MWWAAPPPVWIRPYNRPYGRRKCTPPSATALCLEVLMSSEAERRAKCPLRGKGGAQHQKGCISIERSEVVWFPLPTAVLPPITVSRQKGRPFYGQAEGLLRQTRRPYAGSPQSEHNPFTQPAPSGAPFFLLPRSGHHNPRAEWPLSNLRTLRPWAGQT